MTSEEISVDVDNDDPSSTATPDQDPRVPAPERVGNETNAASDPIEASGRAFGVSVNALGAAVLPAQPDTANDDTTLQPTTVAQGNVSVTVVHVANESDATLSGATSNSVSNLSNVTAGLVSASQVYVHAFAKANSNTAGTSTAGSYISDLVIAGVHYGTITTAQTITVPGVAVVSLLGKSSGDGVSIDGIRIRLLDQALTPVNEASEIVIGHADAFAKYPQGPG